MFRNPTEIVLSEGVAVISWLTSSTLVTFDPLINHQKSVIALYCETVNVSRGAQWHQRQRGGQRSNNWPALGVKSQPSHWLLIVSWYKSDLGNWLMSSRHVGRSGSCAPDRKCEPIRCQVGGGKRLIGWAGGGGATTLILLKGPLHRILSFYLKPLNTPLLMVPSRTLGHLRLSCWGFFPPDWDWFTAFRWGWVQLQ